LIICGANIKANNNEALLTSCKNGYFSIVKLLVQQGATVDNTSLLNSAKNGHFNIMYFLLQNGGNLSYLIDWVNQNKKVEILEYLN